MSGEPLRIELLNDPDFKTDSVEQERRGGVGVGDMDCDDQRIAGMVHVLVRLDFESGNSLTELGLSSGGVWWISVQKGEGDRVDQTEKWKRETHRGWRGSTA